MNDEIYQLTPKGAIASVFVGKTSYNDPMIEEIIKSLAEMMKENNYAIILDNGHLIWAEINISEENE